MISHARRAVSVAGGWNATAGLSSEDLQVVCDNTRVLIADDERPILYLFKTILSLDLPELKVDLAVNGNEAVQTFSEGHHGVVIMDIHMPVMDGQAAFHEIEELCRQKNWSMPSVVFCTGYAPPSAVRAVVSSGSPHCILLKPVTRGQIADAVRSRLAKS